MYRMKSIMVLFFLIFATVSNLSAQIFIEEATYTMGDDDSKITAQNKAIRIAKRAGIEKAGVYTSSYSKAVKGVLKDDVIESFSASIVKATLMEKKFTYPEYWVKVKVDVDIELLNKKMKQFESQGIPVEDQIQSARDEIEQYNKRLDELLQSKKQTKELKNLQETKKLLIQKMSDLEKGKDIQLQMQKDDKYAYLNVLSNVSGSEIYIDNKYIGIAPIHKYKVPSNKEIVIKAINDKRYYTHDVEIKRNFQQLSISDVEMNFQKGKAKLFFLGANDATLYINKQLIKKLNNSNRTVAVQSGKIELDIVSKKGCFSKKQDVWAEGVYEIAYDLELSKCALVNTDIVHNGNVYRAILSPYTQKVWLDRNLGAKRVCKSFDDELCYGDYFQWQKNSTNNSCPKSFRLPSVKEIMDETIKQGVNNRQEAFESFLKIPASGYRYRKDAKLYENGVSSNVWSSDTDSMYAKMVTFTQRHAKEESILQGNGVAIRCIQDASD